MEAHVKDGEKFNFHGRTYKVTKAGETESMVAIVKGLHDIGPEQRLDNKIIVKAITGKPTRLKSEIKEETLSKFKMACEDILNEAAHIDKANVNKNLSDFNKGIIPMAQLIDRLEVNFGIRDDRDKRQALRDHIVASIDDEDEGELSERLETSYEEILNAIKD